MQGWLVVHNNNMLIGKMRYDMVDFYEHGNLEMPFESSMCFYRLCGSLPQRRSGSEQPD